MSTNDEIWTYRPRSAWVTTAAVWLVAGGATAAQAYEGPAALLRALPLGLAGVLLGWLVFWRPRVSVGADGVDVVNPFQRATVPWAALIDVTTRYTCTLVTPHRSVQVFAAPGPGRHAAAQATAADLRTQAAGARDGRRAVSVGELPGSPSGVVATQVRRRWEALAESGALEAGVADETPVTVHVDVRALAALGGLLALGLVAQLLG